jgi:hypothetical protein
VGRHRNSNIIRHGGGTVPTYSSNWITSLLGHTHIPTAGIWANGNTPGWAVTTSPRPGDVAAHANNTVNTEGVPATGHSGIVVGGNYTVSASDTTGTVVQNGWGIQRDNSDVVFRTYIGE